MTESGHTGGKRPTTAGQGLKAISALAVSILVTALALALMLYFDAGTRVLELLRWLDQRGLEAALIFLAVMALVVVLLLPGVLFTTGAGFVFGIVPGTLLVVAGTTLGACVSFAIARHLLNRRAAQWLMAHTRLEVQAPLLRRRGFQIVLLTRLVPLFPFKLSNYVFGLTPVSLKQFAAGTGLGIVPFSLHNAYLGSLAADIATLGATGDNRTPLQWFLYGAGFVALVLCLVYLGRYARKSLDQ